MHGFSQCKCFIISGDRVAADDEQTVDEKCCSLTRDLLSFQYHDLVFLHLQSFQSLIFTPDLDTNVTQVLKQLTVLRE